MRALAEIVACDIHPINNLRVLRYLIHSLGHDEAAIATWYNHWIDAGFQALERLLAEDPRTGRFCHGDAPGLADIALVPQVVNAERYRLDLTPYPTITRIFESCMSARGLCCSAPGQTARSRGVNSAGCRCRYPFRASATRSFNASRSIAPGTMCSPMMNPGVP